MAWSLASERSSPCESRGNRRAPFNNCRKLLIHKNKQKKTINTRQRTLERKKTFLGSKAEQLKEYPCFQLEAFHTSRLADWCVLVCVCVCPLAPVCHPSASPGLDSCRLHRAGPLNLGGYSFLHICYKFTRVKPFKGSFMEPSAALCPLPMSRTWHTCTALMNT